MWLSGKETPADAGDTDSISDPGRSHTLQRNAACAPQLLSLGSSTREATAMRSLRTTTGEQPSLSTTRAKPSQQRTSTAKNKIINT